MNLYEKSANSYRICSFAFLLFFFKFSALDKSAMEQIASQDLWEIVIYSFLVVHTFFIKLLIAFPDS